MYLRFTRKTIAKNIELSSINGLEPATDEKGRVPISNRLRPKEIFERDRCASGWSDIYNHSTNPVKFTYGHLMEIEWLVANVTAVGFPGRAQRAIMGPAPGTGRYPRLPKTAGKDHHSSHKGDPTRPWPQCQGKIRSATGRISAPTIRPRGR